MDSPVQEPARLAKVCLVKRSYVVARGVAHQRYRVRHNQGWVDAERHPSAKVARACENPEDGGDELGPSFALGPGEQYRCEIELSLPLGTLVEKIVTMPVDPSFSPRRSLAGWLSLGQPPRRRLRGPSLFVVAGNYRLEPHRSRQSPGPLRSASSRGPLVSAQLVSAQKVSEFAEQLSNAKPRP